MPGTEAHIETWELVVATALPPAVTVGLPDSTLPSCIVGTMDGSDGCRPTCGGVL